MLIGAVKLEVAVKLGADVKLEVASHCKVYTCSPFTHRVPGAVLKRVPIPSRPQEQKVVEQ